MPAAIIWDTIVSSCTGPFSVLCGAFYDALAVAGRCLVPVAAIVQHAYGSTNPRLSAIVSGSVLPNLMVLGSFQVACVSVSSLYVVKNKGTVHHAAIRVLDFAINVFRWLFAGDAMCQSVFILQRFFGQFCELPELLPGYAVQNVFLCAYLFPQFFDIHSLAPKVQVLLKLVSRSVFHGASLIRIAEKLTDSNATFLAALTLACTAKYIIIFCAHDFLRPCFLPSSLPDSIYCRIESVSNAFFFSVLSFRTSRPLFFDAVPIFFFVKTLSPKFLQYLLSRIETSSIPNAVWSAANWMYRSAWPTLKSLIRRTNIATIVELLGRLSLPLRLLHRWVIAPLWCSMSPLALPSTMAFIAYKCASNALRALSRVMLFTEGVFASTAALSSFVLLCHAWSRISRSSVDPFKFEALRWTVARCCNCVLFPIEVANIFIRYLWKAFFVFFRLYFSASFHFFAFFTKILLRL
jgi:hypothetical protein